jgi:hypothetical protein
MDFPGDRLSEDVSLFCRLEAGRFRGGAISDFPEILKPVIVANLH